MLASLTYIALWITVLITGCLAFIFLRDPDAAMEQAAHRPELLPQVMAGRYAAVFLFAIGVLWLNDLRVTTYFFAVCTFLGLYDGWIYRRRGLAHGKHTGTGVLALGALGFSALALANPGAAVP